MISGDYAMAKAPTAADAQVILQLYDLRRESEMRKARRWFAGSFWPRTADDYVKVATAYSIPENAWLRQVLSYWDMASALVLRGAIHEDVFFDTCGEMWFTLAKVSPILKEVRGKLQAPELLGHVEKLANKTKAGKDRLKKLQVRLDAMSKTFAAAERT
jgi:hypothetical protein